MSFTIISGTKQHLNFFLHIPKHAYFLFFSEWFESKLHATWSFISKYFHVYFLRIKRFFYCAALKSPNLGTLLMDYFSLIHCPFPSFVNCFNKIPLKYFFFQYSIQSSITFTCNYHVSLGFFNLDFLVSISLSFVTLTFWITHCSFLKKKLVCFLINRL